MQFDFRGPKIGDGLLGGLPVALGCEFSQFGFDALPFHCQIRFDRGDIVPLFLQRLPIGLGCSQLSLESL